jgi:acetyl esterase/lipase
VENQFTDVFGAEWKSQISDEEYALMHQYSFSAFDAYFGYDIPTNSKLENVYMVDSPRYVKNESSGIIVSNGSSKYDAIKQKMIFDAYLPAGSKFNTTFDDGKTTKFPVIIMMHGIGMDRGSGNANLTTQYLANLGYLAIDMSYGFSGYCNVNYISGKEKGYDFPDTIQQIGNFTKYLDAHQDEYHADMTNVYFAGRSFGGWMASVCAYGYNNSFMAGNFSSNMIVRGCIPYYPAYDIPSVGMNLLNEFVDVPYFRGSDNPLDADYNPEWIYYRVPELISSTVTTGKLCPTLMFQGTGDYLVNPGWNRQYEAKLREFNRPVIAAYYPQGSHGFDAYHASPYGQSVLYYFARFLALTH